MDHSQHSIQNHGGHGVHDHGAMTVSPIPELHQPGDIIMDSDDHNMHMMHGDSRDTTAMHTMNHMMSMAFHFGYSETILFTWWKIDTIWGLIGSMIVIFIMAILYEGLKYYREYLFWKTYNLLEYRPVTGPQTSTGTPQRAAPAPSASPVQPSMLSWNHLFQTLLHVIQVTLSFLLMLVFMIFNVWLCIAVVLGAAVGYFLFCWKKSVIVDVTEHCH